MRHLQSRQRGGRANKRNRPGRGGEQKLETANGEEGFADVDAGIDLESSPSISGDGKNAQDKQRRGIKPGLKRQVSLVFRQGIHHQGLNPKLETLFAEHDES